MGQGTAEHVAHGHFEAGLEAFKRGEIDAAVDQFEIAYRTSPHYTVLYNLGLAYSAAGRPVEALDALSRYLDEGASSIADARRQQVAASIQYNQRRLGSVDIAVSPQSAELFVDGRRMPARSFRLTGGLHGFVVLAAGFTTETRSVLVSAGANLHLDFVLALAGAPAPSEFGILRTSCRVPGTAVHVDGDAPFSGEHPRDTIVRAGTHSVRFLRDGYDEDRQAIVVRVGESREIMCALRPHDKLPRNRTGRLAIRCPRKDAWFSVDGTEYSGQSLPAGKHLVEAHCPDCAPWSLEVDLAPEVTRWLEATPTLLPEAAQRMRRERDRNRTLMWASAGAGLALGISSAALFATYRQRSSEWSEEARRLDSEFAAGSGSLDDQFRQASEHQSGAGAIQETRGLAVGFAVASVTAFAASAVFYWLTPSIPAR